MRRLKVCAVVCLLANVSWAGEATFTVTSDFKKTVFKRSDLLKHPKLETKVFNNLYSYPGREMALQVIPLVELLQPAKFKSDSIIEFKATDGFAGAIPTARVLDSKQRRSLPFLAIEPIDTKWPPILFQDGKPSAGPFYLVWSNPELSQISESEWPFQLESFTEKPPINKTYPALVPNKTRAQAPAAWAGLTVFTRNCFPCHTLNLAGPAQFGPDLNIPMNPLEYFNEKALRKLIRDPQSVRKWRDSRMNGFNATDLPDKDLDNLFSYLKHMASQKVNY